MNHCTFVFKHKSICDLTPTRQLTHWGRLTRWWVSELTIIGWGNDLSLSRSQAIIWTNVFILKKMLINLLILLIWHLGTNFSEILIKMFISSFKKLHLNMSSAKFCVRLNVLRRWPLCVYSRQEHFPSHGRHGLFRYNWPAAQIHFRDVIFSQIQITYSKFVAGRNLCSKLDGSASSCRQYRNVIMNAMAS